MLDGFSLDQLRAFIAAADAGSFLAAGRQLLRAQLAVSELISRLEGEVGLLVFSRSGRYPILTPQGAILLADARAVVADVDIMRAGAKRVSAGIESEVFLVIGAMFPIAAIATAAIKFRDQFPATSLRLFVEASGNGFSATDRQTPKRWHRKTDAWRHIVTIDQTAPPHSALGKHTQLVLTDRTLLTAGKDVFVRL